MAARRIVRLIVSRWESCLASGPSRRSRRTESPNRATVDVQSVWRSRGFMLIMSWGRSGARRKVPTSLSIPEPNSSPASSYEARHPRHDFHPPHVRKPPSPARALERAPAEPIRSGESHVPHPFLTTSRATRTTLASPPRSPRPPPTTAPPDRHRPADATRSPSGPNRIRKSPRIAAGRVSLGPSNNG